ncbi:MAG: guanitoxin biosynthesis pre-guanitoxin forming N-methyltransferase GntF [Acidimicrobiales bacterium]
MDLEPGRRFDQFSAAEYLREYYSEVGPENHELLRFFADIAPAAPMGEDLLEYGGGPTVYQLLSLAPRVGGVVFGDYLAENLEAVSDWIDGRPGAHDWAPFARAALRHEGLDGSGAEAEHRLAVVRQRIRTLCQVDALDETRPAVRPDGFAFVSTNFVAESIANSGDEWRRAVRAIAGNVRPGGHLAMTAIRNAERWRIGDHWFPALPVDANDIRSALAELGHRVEHLVEIDAEVLDRADPRHEGYDGMVFCLSRHRSRGSHT